MKKTLAILLVLAMLIGVFSGMTITSGAASADTAQTGNGIGTTGTCTWQYVEYQHRLTINGNSVSGWSTKFVIKKPADTQKTDTTAKKGVTYQYGFATGKYVKENGKNVLKLTSGIRTSSKITATRK